MLIKKPHSTRSSYFHRKLYQAKLLCLPMVFKGEWNIPLRWLIEAKIIPIENISSR